MRPEKGASQRWGEGIRISEPRLYRMEFVNEAAEEAVSEGLHTEFEISFARLAELELAVQFEARVTSGSLLNALVGFRMAFQLMPGSPEANEPERAFRAIGARLAPVTIYPWIRETLASVALKSGLRHLVLPIQNIGGLWSEDEIAIPPPPGISSAENQTEG